MRKFALLAAAAVCLSPAFMSTAGAETDVNIRVNAGTPTYYNPGYRAYGATRTRTVVTGPHCRQVTVRTKRANGTIWVRKIRKCD